LGRVLVAVGRGSGHSAWRPTCRSARPSCCGWKAASLAKLRTSWRWVESRLPAAA